MQKDKYKILVLSDLKKSASSTLKSTVSLAKMIDGDISFFHVKKPIDILEKDNQLSAFRTINEQHNITNKKIEKLVKPLSKEFGVNINYSYTFGNIKNEIEKHIHLHQPDIVVLGRREPKTLKVFGDSVTQFVLKIHPGVVMIAANENALQPNKQIALALLNGAEESINLEFAEHLMAHAQKPLKSFKIAASSNPANETQTSTDAKTVEYVFEQSDNAINNLSNYLLKSNINLLYIDREKDLTKNQANQNEADIKEAISKLNVSLLLTASKKQAVQ